MPSFPCRYCCLLSCCGRGAGGASRRGWGGMLGLGGRGGGGGTPDRALAAFLPPRQGGNAAGAKAWASSPRAVSPPRCQRDLPRAGSARRWGRPGAGPWSRWNLAARLPSQLLLPDLAPCFLYPAFSTLAPFLKSFLVTQPTRRNSARAPRLMWATVIPVAGGCYRHQTGSWWWLGGARCSLRDTSLLFFIFIFFLRLLL